MTLLVVDSSVAAKWFFREEFSNLALKILSDAYELHAPDFLLFEVNNIICKHIRRKEISQAEGDEIRLQLQNFPLTLLDSKILLNSAFRIANDTKTSIYDCLYMALAYEMSSRVITADLRFYNKMKTGYPDNLFWIGNLG